MGTEERTMRKNKHKRWLAAWLLAAIGTAIALLAGSTPAPAAFPGVNGKIAFESDRDGNYDIYVMNADGSDQVSLTDSSGYNLNPAWSPDGRKIAFESFRDGNPEIYVMNADGSNQTRLTYDEAADNQPAWSPDGSKIAFVSYRDGDYEIYVMDADGSGQTRLSNRPGVDRDPAWSPDGSKIAFTSERDGNPEIYVMNADGSSQTRLTYSAGLPDQAWLGIDQDPAWSPDGSKIAFTSYRDGDTAVFVMNADGSAQTRLSEENTSDFGPAWSPDGSKISFFSYRSGRADVYVMNADGSAQTRLTDNPAADQAPDWQPIPATTSSEKIAFVSDRDGSYEVYVMNRDGSGQTRLTGPGLGVNDWPSWSPDGGRIAFTSDRDGNWQIYLMNADGSNQTRITDGAYMNYRPSWSVGGKIAFESNRAAGNLDIYAMNADGSNQARLTDDPGDDARATWSPDGSKIAFESNRTGNWEIWVMNADGSGEIQLTDNPGDDFAPSWSPDGQRIAFSSDRGSSYEVYVMNADGSELRQLTDTPAWNYLPAWSPDGSEIAFVSLRDGTAEVYTMNPDGGSQTRLTHDTSSEHGLAWQPLPIPDRTAPTIACEAPDATWHPENVTLSCTASDSGSGLEDPEDASFALSTAVPAGIETADAQTGVREVCDKAGNCAVAGPIGGNEIDKKAPSIALSVPTAGATYVLREVVLADYSCTDGGSGVASCGGPVADGAPLDTSSVGARSFSVSAADNAGNVAPPLSARYAVVYGQRLLFNPMRPSKMITLRLIDARRRNVSSASIVLTVKTIDRAPVSGQRFTFVRGRAAYTYTPRVVRGSHVLTFVAGADPTTHVVAFVR